jgi:hypothetical protein
MALTTIPSGMIAPAQTLSVNGITFPATQSPSADANTLDDYEEGTWTPTPTSDGTQPTIAAYLDRVGTYTKVGNTVNVRCNLRLNISNAGSGNARVTGLPFIASSAAPGPAFPGIAFGLRGILSGGVSATAQTYVDGNIVVLDGCSWAAFSGPYLTFQATYQVA